MVTPEAMVAAMMMGGRGAQVPVPLSTTTGVTPTAVFQCTLPDFMSSPFVITAGPLLGNAALAVGNSIGAALEIRWGYGNQSVTALVDLPVGGTVVQVPPCGRVQVTALVSPPTADIPGAGWSVFAVDGEVNAPHPVLTAPFKTLAASENRTFLRPALALAYRLIATDRYLAEDTAYDCTQTNSGGTVLLSADQPNSGTPLAKSFYPDAAGRSGWVPLHPLTTEVKIDTDGSGGMTVTVQWLLSLGGIG